MHKIRDMEILKSMKNFLFDCDGVIWKQNNVIPGAVELINLLKANGKKVFLVSNNSTLSVEDYVKKCAKFGLQVQNDEIVCSSNILANYLKSMDFKGKAYVVGGEGMSIELTKVGIENFGVGEEKRFYRSLGTEDDFLDNDVKGVVVGFDEYFNLTKMTIACAYITRKHCQFFATNADAVFPTTIYPIPGTGSMVNAIATASCTDPIVTGKPFSPMFKVLQDKYDLEANESVMIGDNLDTDITFGNDHNMKTLLVLTGVASISDLTNLDPKSNRSPAFVTDSVKDLLNVFQ